MKTAHMILVALIFAAVPAYALPVQSHPADQVKPGAFQSGNYNFPGSLGIGAGASSSDRLKVSATTGNAIKGEVTGSGYSGYFTGGSGAYVDGDVRWTGTLQSGTVPWARLSGYPSITASGGLAGGGDLSAGRTVSIADGGVSTAKIADSAVTTGKISDSGITTAKIADSAVTTAKFADGGITTAKIADSAVTSAKISDGTIAAADISDSAVTTAKIANDAIISAKIADGTISSGDVGFNYAGSSGKGGAATTAAALSSNGANCGAGQYAQGIDASGNAEGCTAVPSGADNLGNHKATQALDLSSNRITGVAAPTASSDAATKGYVDAQTAGGKVLYEPKCALTCTQTVSMYSADICTTACTPPSCASGYTSLGTGCVVSNVYQAAWGSSNNIARTAVGYCERYCVQS